jgi:hypothetical protein
MLNASSASPAPEKFVGVSLEGVNVRGSRFVCRRCSARRVTIEEKKKNVAPRKKIEDCLRARRVAKADRTRVRGVDGAGSTLSGEGPRDVESGMVLDVEEEKRNAMLSEM